jgi:DnaJ-class molecular chaperone
MKIYDKLHYWMCYIFFRMYRKDSCPECNGSKFVEDYDLIDGYCYIKCPTCNGRGKKNEKNKK